MTPEELFARTLDDLHKAIHSHDEYESLQASKYIRQLFLDGSQSLVDVVNRTHKCKLVFDIVEVTPPIPLPATWCAEIDPRVAVASDCVVTLKRDAFFKTRVAIADGHSFSVHEVVD
jgi:hypothetical protein